jgi:ketosteroid isomerase-like protein
MSTAAEHLQQDPHVDTIKRYYAACNSGDVDGVIACCKPDVVHFFLARGIEPVRGAEHLGRYWRKVQRVIPTEWRVEHAIACDDEAVIEYSQLWTSPEDGKRYLWHGAEWYAFRAGLICEIRAYYDFGRDRDTGLVGFPYAERGYTVRKLAGE